MPVAGACAAQATYAEAPAADLSQPATLSYLQPLELHGEPGTPLNNAQLLWNQAPTAENGLALLARLLQANPLPRAQMLQARTLATALAVRFPRQPLVRAQLGYFWFRLEDFRQARADFYQALQGDIWSAEQRRNLHQALANSAAAMGDFAGAVEALRPVAVAGDPAMLLLLGRAQVAAKQRPQALKTARLALAATEDPALRAEAEALARAALKPSDDPRAFRQLSQGYGYLRHGEDLKGLQAFEAGFALGGGKAFHYADAAYAAKRLSKNRMAAADFRFALELDESEPGFAPQQVFGYSREIEVLEREFGAQFGSPYQAGALDVWQIAAEGFWQPEGVGYRDGRTLQFFLRTFANLRNGASGAVGAETAQGGVGVRYKPWASQNVVFALERLVALGQRTSDDWLLRTAYSIGAGTDLQVQKRWWPQWQVYADVSWYTDAARLLASAEGRYGPALAIDGWPELTILPCAVAALEFDSAAQQQGVGVAGAGANVRLWFGRQRHRAPSSWLEIHGSYRWATADRGQGPVVRATLWL